MDDVMNAKRVIGSLFLASLCTGLASTDEPRIVRLLAPVETIEEVQPKDQEKQPGKDKDKKPPEKKLSDQPDTDIFTQAPAPIREALGFNPQMLGDKYGKFAFSTVTFVGTQTLTTTTTTQQIVSPGGPPITTTQTTTTSVSQSRNVLIPVPGQGAFKVAENASPIPVDRFFFTYNFFNDIRSVMNGQNLPITSTQTATTQRNIRGTQITTTTTSTATIPGTPSFVDLHREVIGFEKTFLDGNASIELRIPVSQQLSSLDEFRSQHLNDITIIGKYAFLFNRDTGDVLSGGLAITAPTGGGIETIDGTVNSTLLQPWIGYVLNLDRFYVHAFHSVVLPTDNRDVSLFFNDFGIGYWTYLGSPDRAIRFVVPTFEAHITTPLSNREAGAPITVPDVVVLTAGMHVGMFRNSILTIGVGAPISGPRVYGMEAYVQYNRRF